jgi:FecR protein
MMRDAGSSDNDLIELLSALWDDRLDDASRSRLEDLLSRNEFAQIKKLYDFTQLHLELEWYVSSKVAQEKALESLRKIRSAPEENVSRYRRWRTIGFVGLASSILLSVIYVWFSARPGLDKLVRSPRPVGKVVHLEDANWVSGTGLQASDIVVEGQTVDIPRGFAQLSMGFGADVMLQGPCRARIVSSDRIALQRGKLAVRAAKWAIGFKVETDDLVATDLGTWFSVQSGGGPAEIHVLEGTVLAKAVNEGTSSDAARRLKADEAVHMTRDGAFQTIKFRREAAAEKLTQFQPLRPIQVWNTGIGLREGENDPHWTVTTGDNRVGPYPQPAVVAVPDACYGINEPERSQWISVRRGTTRGVPAWSRYTFESTLDLTGFDLGSVWVFGQVLADDGVDEVWLNGKRLSIKPWKDWSYGVQFVNFHPIEIRSGFVPGVNRLAFVVKNETIITPSKKGFDLPDRPNPMAFRAEWQAFGRPISGPN